MPKSQNSFTLKRVLRVLCYRGHPVYSITGKNEESKKFLGTWRWWCPTCQELTVTQDEALKAHKDGRAGTVVGVALRLRVGK